MSGEAVEVWFYHLERSGLEEVLAPLLDRTLQRGWRALVRSGDPGGLAALDAKLWTVRPDVVAPHGLATEPNAERQPVVLTAGTDNPNGAQALFLVAGAQAGEIDGFARVLDVFDGRDAEATAAARERWKGLKAKGAALSYWTQTEAGDGRSAHEDGGHGARARRPGLGGVRRQAAGGRRRPPHRVAAQGVGRGSRRACGRGAARAHAAAPSDTCGAADLAYLVGKPRTEIPIPADLTHRRVVCSTCPLTTDVMPERQTITYDSATHLVTKVSCG